VSAGSIGTSVSFGRPSPPFGEQHDREFVVGREPHRAIEVLVAHHALHAGDQQSHRPGLARSAVERGGDARAQLGELGED